MNFEAYQNTLHRLLTHFCTKSLISDNLSSDYLTTLVAENIAASHELLDTLTLAKATDYFEIHTNPFSMRQYTEHQDHSYLSPLVDIYKIVKKELGPFVDGFYLHGSLATMDYVKGWSDVDTFVVLSRKTATSRDNLLQLRPILGKIHCLMKKIAPLQHHGVMVITAIDLKSYPENLLPLRVFERLKLMTGKGELISGHVRASTLDFEPLKNKLGLIVKAHEKGIFEHHAYSDEYLLSEYRNANNGMYQLKYYLEQFLLLPSLYLTAIGDGCYKKESFERVQNIFPAPTIEWIELISELREEWGKITGEDYEPNEIPTWVRRKIPSNYLATGAKAGRALLKHIEKVEKSGRDSE